MPTLQEQIKALNEQLVTQVPLETLKNFQRSITDLQTTYSEKDTIKIGAAFPEFELTDPSGQTIHLQDIHTEETLIIAFFRGSWCPYCNLELQALEKALPLFHAKKSRLIAVSPQSPVYNDNQQQTHRLSFPLLTDSENKLAQQLGITFRLQDFVRPDYQKLGIQLEDFNADSSGILPIPAIFVIDRNAQIRYIYLDPDYRNRIEIATLTAQL
ncbi:peroxiredoxin-like family protein [Flavobacterium sp. CAU 1735]|uniref:peroxiredoxin-like family protein n=1 Tax=Flavobacterium sp. CAU 1735 TaxID=3140361 RepID=UPI00326159A3